MLILEVVKALGIVVTFYFFVKLAKKENWGMVKPLSFMPYCCKPFDCPVGRKNQRCVLLENGECDLDCSITDGVIFSILSGVNINDIFIIDKDEYLFSWLEDKSDEGYDFIVIGVGCDYAINMAWDYVRSLGFVGNVVSLKGDVCNKEKDYDEMEERDAGKKTYFNIEEMRFKD